MSERAEDDEDEEEKRVEDEARNAEQAEDGSSNAPPVELTKREIHEVHDRMLPRAAVLHETIRTEGEHELHRSSSSLGWSGLAAGTSMGFSIVAMGVLRSLLPDTPWRQLVVSIGYPVGFLIVIIGRQQLFTENSLTPVLPLLHNRDVATLIRVLRLWGTVLLSNMVGVFLFALAIAHTDIFPLPVRAAFGDIGAESLEGSALTHFLRGIFSGWLIALLVWLMPSAETSRVFLIVVITYLIGAAGLSHIIAGSVESIFAVMAHRGTWSEYFGHFFFPVLIGNTLGGSALVGALAHAQVVAERDLENSQK